VHLAEQLAGNREFIRGTLAAVIRGTIPPRVDDKGVTVFSHFGLGVLDIAVGKLVTDRAASQGRGTVIKAFSSATMAERAWA